MPEWDSMGWNRRVVLADGTQLMFYNDTGELGKIAVDVNGGRKPNKMGRDVFVFQLTENSLIPFGCNKDKTTMENECKNWGWQCACKVLREGAINY